MNVFDEMGNYWAEIADQNSTQEQVQFINSTIMRMKVGGSILDVACGTGRHLISLAKDGVDVVGLDISPSLLTIAKNRLSDAQLVRADMLQPPFVPQAFSAATSLDTSFGYLPSELDDLQSLREIWETLAKKSILIIDIFNRELLIQKYPARKSLKWGFFPLLLRIPRLGKPLLFRFFNWREYSSFFLLQKRTVDADGSKLQDLWVIRDKTKGRIKVFKHVARLYEKNFLQQLLEQAGFAVEQVYGGYNGEQYSLVSKRLILVVVKVP